MHYYNALGCNSLLSMHEASWYVAAVLTKQGQSFLQPEAMQPILQ